MVDIEHHHRRIRRKAKAVHIGILPLAFLVPLAWLYFAYGFCQEAQSAWQLAVCGVLRFAPLTPAAAGIAALLLILWDLSMLGGEHLQAHSGRKTAREHWAHAAHGYRSLDPHHRRHVRFATAQVALVAAGLTAWLALEWYRATH